MVIRDQDVGEFNRGSGVKKQARAGVMDLRQLFRLVRSGCPSSLKFVRLQNIKISNTI